MLLKKTKIVINTIIFLSLLLNTVYFPLYIIRADSLNTYSIANANLITNSANNLSVATTSGWSTSTPTINKPQISVDNSGIVFDASSLTTSSDYGLVQKNHGGSSDFVIEYVQKAKKYYTGASFGFAFSADTEFSSSLATNGLTVRYNMSSSLNGRERAFDGLNKIIEMPLDVYSSETSYNFRRVKIIVTKDKLQIWSQNDSGEIIQSVNYSIPLEKQTDSRNILTIFSAASSSVIGDVTITHDGVTTREFKTGTNYYVSQTDGNDFNNGLSASTPWKTFANFNNSKVLTPGSQVLLKRGDVWNERLTLHGAGSISNWIYVGDYGDKYKNKPMISLNNSRDDIGLLYQDIISVMPISSPIGYIHFENLDIRNTRLGIYVRQITTRGAQGVKITNCDFSNINCSPVMTEIGKTDADIPGELRMAKGNLPFFNGSSYVSTGGGSNEYLFPTAVMIGGISRQATASGGYPSQSMLSDIIIRNCVFEKSINGIMSWMYLYNDGTYKDTTKNWIVDGCAITGTVNGIIGFDSVNGGYNPLGNYWGMITNNKVVYGSETDTFKDGTTGLINQGSKNLFYDYNTFSNVKRNGRNDGCGFDFEGGDENIILQNSVFNNNDGQAILMMKSTGSMPNKNITIRNNLFYNNLVNRASSGYNKEITIFNSDNQNISLVNNTRYSRSEATALATYSNSNGVTESGTVTGNLATYIESVPQICFTASLYSWNQILITANGSSFPFFTDNISVAGFSVSDMPGGVGIIAAKKINYNSVLLTFSGLVSNKMADFATTLSVNANQFIKPFENAINGYDSMGKIQNPRTYYGSLFYLMPLFVPVIFDKFKVTLGGSNIISGLTEGMTPSVMISNLTIRNGTNVTFGELSPQFSIATGTKVYIETGDYINTYTALLYGDIDSDGKITVSDLAYLKSYLLGKINLTGLNLEAARAKRTGTVSISDLLTIKKHILKFAEIKQN